MQSRGCCLVSMCGIKSTFYGIFKMKKLTELFLAGAIGDAFGYLVEFDDVKTIKQKFGNNGLTFNRMYDNIACSDDTQMTLFLMEAIKNWDVDAYGEDGFREISYNAYLDWYHTQVPKEKKLIQSLMNFKNKKVPESNKDFELKSCDLLYHLRAPGNTCLSAMSKQVNKSLSNLELDMMVNDSKGCGSIMRVAPVLFLQEKFKNFSDVDLIGASHIQSAITHGNYEGMFVTAVYTLILKELLSGTDKNIVLSKVLNFMNRKENDKFKVLERLKEKDHLAFTEMSNYFTSLQSHIDRNDVLRFEEIEEFGGGWDTTTCFGLSFYAFMKSSSFEECIELATNHSGDSDSTATLACQLYASCNSLDLSKYKKTDLTDIVYMLSEK